MTEADAEAVEGMVNRALKRWQAAPIRVTPDEIEPRLLRIERDLEILREEISRVSDRLTNTGMERIGRGCQDV